MEIRNQKLINAIIDKANRECPGALAMIGIYGSFCTGDIHEKSDLDLMILINDDRGYGLATLFLLEDEGIGHDLYCTTWEALERDATFCHPHIAKLMDSKIVYCADEAFRSRLEALRSQAMEADTQKHAEAALKEGESCFAKAMIASDLTQCRSWTEATLYKLNEAIALKNNRYFRLGTRRIFQEIEAMPLHPANYSALVNGAVCTKELSALKNALVPLLQSVEDLFTSAVPSPEVIPGTYEEMFSNWRNKMYLAAETKNPYLSFDCMSSLDFMLKELGYFWNILDRFDPTDLRKSAEAYDGVLAQYLEEYRKAGVALQSYPDVDAFIAEYEKKKA